jgi:hypothetical protein
LITTVKSIMDSSILGNRPRDTVRDGTGRMISGGFLE